MVMEKRMKELQEASGSVTYTDALTKFFYTLISEHLPAGVVEKLVFSIIYDSGDEVFTNGWLAKYANNLSEQLLNAKSIRLKHDLEEAFRYANKQDMDSNDIEALDEAGLDDDIMLELKNKLDAASKPFSSAYAKTMTPEEAQDVATKGKTSIEEACNDIFGPDLDDTISKPRDYKQQKLNAIKDTISKIDSMGFSEETKKEIKDDLNKITKEVFKTEIIVKSPEEMKDVVELTTKDKDFINKDVLSLSKDAETESSPSEPTVPESNDKGE
jgi:hypothetical protein